MENYQQQHNKQGTTIININDKSSDYKELGKYLAPTFFLIVATFLVTTWLFEHVAVKNGAGYYEAQSGNFRWYGRCANKRLIKKYPTECKGE